ncbi:unnamed protein product [Ectocarpus sp. 6 AP-2014]
MGGVVGKGSTPVPEYNVLGHGASYELRAYDGYVVAEVENSGEGSEDDRFRTLAKYIGVFGNPANKVAGGDAGENIAMTAPVVTGDPTPDSGKKISMTAPVVVGPGTGASTMQFIMPKQFKRISDLPTPTDSRVSLREVPEAVYLVHQFSGNMGRGDGHDAIAERERMVAMEKVASEGGAFSEYVSADSKFLVARYDPPWTLPFLRTNELWFPVPLSPTEATAKLPTA